MTSSWRHHIPEKRACQCFWFCPKFDTKTSRINFKKVSAMGIFKNLKLILTRCVLLQRRMWDHERRCYSKRMRSRPTCVHMYQQHITGAYPAQEISSPLTLLYYNKRMRSIPTCVMFTQLHVPVLKCWNVPSTIQKKQITERVESTIAEQTGNVP